MFTSRFYLAVVPRVAGEPGAPCCMYRATDGKRRKMATLVGLEDKDEFHAKLLAVLKTDMREGLLAAPKTKKAKSGGSDAAAGAAGGGGSGGGGR